MRSISQVSIKAISIALLATGAVPAFAQAEQASVSAENEVPDIIVTAQRRSENLQKVPIAATALTGDDLDAKAVQRLADLQFAWRVCKFVKSNAIVYARERTTIGVGAGQMSRVYSSRVAAMKAADEKLEVAGAVMASDAFFPFRDGLDVAAELGIKAVIQPGGSKRDDEVIAAADEHGMAMVFTGMRHFRH